MNCKMFRIQLEHTECERGKSPLSPDMQAHFESCTACREHLQFHQQMLAVLESDSAPALPPNFTAKILDRLEPIFAANHAAPSLSWKRLAVYAGSVSVVALALWFGYKNIHWTAVNQLLHSPVAQQIQQWLAAIGAAEILPAVQNFLTRVFSFIPDSHSLFEKAFGKEVLPRAINLSLILLLTFTVAKVSVFLESWLRQISRRRS
jgi:hypothetical protein